MSKALLKIENLSIRYRVDQNACHQVNIEIKDGERVGIVGESGCGKTTLLKSIIRLLPKDAKVQSGDIIYQNESLLLISNRKTERN
jgi:peptide/nickel transport system ATP-binding protein